MKVYLLVYVYTWMYTYLVCTYSMYISVDVYTRDYIQLVLKVFNDLTNIYCIHMRWVGVYRYVLPCIGLGKERAPIRWYICRYNRPSLIYKFAMRSHILFLVFLFSNALNMYFHKNTLYLFRKRIFEWSLDFQIF